MVQFNTAWCSLPQHGVLNIRPEGPKQQATRTLIAGVFKKPSLETAAIRDQQLFSVHTGPTAVWCSYGTNRNGNNGNGNNRNRNNGKSARHFKDTLARVRNLRTLIAGVVNKASLPHGSSSHTGTMQDT